MFNGIILVSPENTGIPAKRQVRETFTRRKDRFLQMRNVTGPTQRWDFGFREAREFTISEDDLMVAYLFNKVVGAPSRSV